MRATERMHIHGTLRIRDLSVVSAESTVATIVEASNNTPIANECVGRLRRFVVRANKLQLATASVDSVGTHTRRFVPWKPTKKLDLSNEL